MAVKLGSTGLEVSKMGFGCMGMTAFYGPPMSEADAVELLKGVHNLGYTHFDTAEVYRSKDPPQSNEELISAFLKTLPRESFTVATKFFPGIHEGNCDADTVTESFNASLERLGVGYVDLYYLHRMPQGEEQLVSWMKAAKSLVEAGKVKHLGLSEASPEQIRKAHAIHPIAAIQQEWSLVTRDLCESKIVPVCKELNIGLVAYSPLARNLLCTVEGEAPDDWRSGHPRYQGENWEKNKQLAAKVSALAEAKGKTGAQLSMAWLYHQAKAMGVAMVPIPGTTKLKHATDNMGGADLELADDDMKALAELGALVAGARGNESYQTMSLEGQL